MIILQGNTYLLPIQVSDCNNNVVTADRVTKGQFIFGKYEKFYSEEGEIRWSEQLQAFLFPLNEQETFELNGVIKYQARLFLNDGSVSGSVPENYYVYESITKSMISNGEVGQESSNLLKVKLVMPVVNEGGGGGISKETDPTVPDYVKNISEEDIDSWDNKATTKYVDEQVDDVREVAEGKTKSFTVKSLSNLGTLLGIDTSVVSNEYVITTTTITYKEKVYDLKQGDMFFIVDTSVPDYWVSVDDMKIYKMETTKVDLTNYVTFDDTAESGGDYGLVKVGTGGTGIQLNKNGVLQSVSATDSEIETEPESSYRNLQPRHVSKIVKKGLSNSNETWTDAEKQSARTQIGALGVDNISLTLKDNGAYTLTINKE